jgi:hypothetical protein
MYWILKSDCWSLNLRLRLQVLHFFYYYLQFMIIQSRRQEILISKYIWITLPYSCHWYPWLDILLCGWIWQRLTHLERDVMNCDLFSRITFDPWVRCLVYRPLKSSVNRPVKGLQFGKYMIWKLHNSLFLFRSRNMSRYDWWSSSRSNTDFFRSPSVFYAIFHVRHKVISCHQCWLVCRSTIAIWPLTMN